MKSIGICATVLMLSSMLLGQTAFGLGIRSTKHNLSVSGPGQVKAVTETQICIFCHTPHSARRDIPFLWNRSDQTATYVLYQSSTLVANVGQPTGASKLCLSCHDGTIALGNVISEPEEIQFRGGIRFIPEGATRLSTDLSDDHPVSFVYDSNLAQTQLELVDPALLPPAVKLDSTGQLQCTACHDPHDDTFGDFLVMPNQFSDLCVSCHEMQGWRTSSHAVSNARWNGKGANPWPDTQYETVAENGCENCHRPHGAPSPEWLLNRRLREDNCLVCHSGAVASANIELELTKRYGHFVQDFSGIHDPAEDFSFGGVNKHVECEDCHNPHQANGDHAFGAPRVSGPNVGVSGVDPAGIQVPDAQDLYEICYKCHADNNMLSVLPITRQIDQLNTRLEFDPANPSFHPVQSAGQNLDVPSLLSPYSARSVISCTDCHNNNDALGPKGPHGSAYEFLLEANYRTLDYTSESPATYALCYKCHSRNSILNNQSFARHRQHIQNEKTPCSACHDPHGISNLQGNPVNNSHLINFDLNIVGPDNLGRLQFEDQGRFRGQCFLTCHGQVHAPRAYP